MKTITEMLDDMAAMEGPANSARLLRFATWVTVLTFFLSVWYCTAELNEGVATSLDLLEIGYV